MPKLSAGYFAAPGMDLIDLFIGSEGTLGVDHRGDAARAAGAAGDVPGVRAVRRSRGGARVRHAGCATRRARPGARAIRAAWTCRRSSTWTRAAWRCCARTAPTARNGVAIPASAAIALLVTLELPAGMTSARCVRRDRPRARAGRARHAARPLLPRARRSRRARRVEIAVPGDRARASISCSRCAKRCRPASTRASAARSSTRRADREDRGGHDRAVRSARRAAGDLRRGVPRAAASTPRSGATSPTATCTRT